MVLLTAKANGVKIKTAITILPKCRRLYNGKGNNFRMEAILSQLFASLLKKEFTSKKTLLPLGANPTFCS